MASRSDDLGQCKRGCCWNPHAVCGRGYKCDHHTQSTADAVEKEIADFAAQLEIACTRNLRPWIR